MTKSDFPALRMTIDGGRLVPAGPFDAERLNSYRRGTVVYVRFTEEKDRVLIRKWFAVLGLVLKQCRTPWNNRDEAHEAIKLALGIVNLSKTVGGDYMQYPKSLSELEDPELQEALDNMIDLLSAMTGVDVATLRKETAHISEDPHDPATGEIIEPESGDAPAPDATESPSSVAEPAGALIPAGSSLADTTDSRGGSVSEPEAAGGSPAPDEPPAASRDPEMEILIRFAKDVLPMAGNPDTAGPTLGAVEKRWASEIVKLSPERQEQAKAISRSMRAIFNGNTSLESAIDFYAEALGCTIYELGADANG